jgi:hypothetical protein
VAYRGNFILGGYEMIFFVGLHWEFFRRVYAGIFRGLSQEYFLGLIKEDLGS